MDYEARKRTLLKHRIGLWDVIDDMRTRGQSRFEHPRSASQRFFPRDRRSTRKSCAAYASTARPRANASRSSPCSVTKRSCFRRRRPALSTMRFEAKSKRWDGKLRDACVCTFAVATATGLVCSYKLLTPHAQHADRIFPESEAGGLPVSVARISDLARSTRSKRVIDGSVDDFYYLSRACLVKDEAHYDKFDRVFGAYFKGVDRLLEGATRLDTRRVAAEARREAPDRGGEEADRVVGRLGQADGDAEEAPRRAEGAAPGRQQVDRHRRHQPVRRLRLQPRGRAHRPARGAQPPRGQGVGPARIQQSRRYGRARHPQHQGRAAAAAQVRARRRARGARSRRHHTLDRQERRLSRHQDGAGAAQQREGAAVPRRRRLDGRPHHACASSSSRRRGPSSSISNISTSTIALRARVEGQPAAPRPSAWRRGTCCTSIRTTTR